MPQKSATTRPEGSMKRNTVRKSVGKSKRKAKLARHAVLKMLAVMEGSQNAGPSSSKKGSDSKTCPPPTPTCESGVVPSPANREDFLASGRTGRRNALPDILGQNASVTSSDLPTRLEALTTTDKKDNNKEESPCSSKS